MTRLTQSNARKVLMKIADDIEKNSDAAAVWIEELTKMLDALAGEDFFGTEGQLDPRGDHRD